MRPNSQFTSPDQRFFYPTFAEVEFHESLPADNLPGVEQIAGNDHHIVFETDDLERYAQRLEFNHAVVPAGSTLLEVVSLKETTNGLTPHAFPDYGTMADRGYTIAYNPHSVPGIQAVVQVDKHGAFNEDGRFDKHGVAILPIDKPLPEINGTYRSMQNVPARYTIHGFINPTDKFVTWTGPTSFETQLVDWSVANALAKNALEMALLYRAIGNGRSLIGTLGTKPGTLAYLQYFDAKHKTHFLPDNEPRLRVGEDFPPLTTDQSARYHKLVDLADVRIPSE